MIGFGLRFSMKLRTLFCMGLKKKSVYLDDISVSSEDSKEEREANQWAGQFLIPPQYEAGLLRLKSKQAVCSFAGKIGLHPGIVVGRLQHDGVIPISWMNRLKVSFRFSG